MLKYDIGISKSLTQIQELNMKVNKFELGIIIFFICSLLFHGYIGLYGNTVEFSNRKLIRDINEFLFYLSVIILLIQIVFSKRLFSKFPFLMILMIIFLCLYHWQNAFPI
jgi:hypothetical protein